jgi:signal peptidase I
VSADDVSNTVVRASESVETRRTSAIAPSSGISLQQAEDAAVDIQQKVPGTLIYSVKPTGSMRPLFDGNCLLLAEQADFDALEIGDIVVFRHSRTKQLVVHRILERRAGGYWTKGDKNSQMDDDLVTAENYQARLYGIIYTERTGKNIAATAQKNLNILAAAN